jgi:hypothetical protein
MPIDRDTLDAIARSYSATMTSIRGRRVYRLVMRELSRFDHVLPATAEDGTPALLALGADGSAAVCRTDGRGPAAPVATWSRLGGASVTTSYDLLKDSLPVVAWTVWHPGFAALGGAVTISAADVSPADRGRVATALRSAGA